MKKIRCSFGKIFGRAVSLLSFCLSLLAGCAIAGQTQAGIGTVRAAEPGFVYEVESQSAVPEGYTAITTAEELENIKSGNYILMEDIDLSGRESVVWSTFSGNLDGNGHCVIGQKAPLIGTMTGGSVKDLGLTDVSIQDDSGNAGALVRKLSTKKAISIYNVYVSGMVTGSGSTGGIVGRDSSISTYSTSISGCANYALVAGVGANVGGIIGANNSEHAKISLGSLYNYGIVRGKGKNVGGIAGALSNIDYNLSVSNCHNEGAVIGTESVGGIAGNHWVKVSTKSTSATFSHLSNAGTIKGKTCVGGIVGATELNDGNRNYDTKMTLSYCSNKGKIDCGSSSSGGIVGMVKHSFDRTPSGASTIRNCISQGEMRSGGNIAGRAYLATGSLKIEKCIGLQFHHSGVAGIIDDTSSYNGMSTGRTVISDCYFRNTLCSYAYSKGGKTSGAENGLTDSQCKEESSYANLDFGYIWKIAPEENGGYPFLTGREEAEPIEPPKPTASEEEKNQVKAMLQRTSYEKRPFGEFSLPLYFCADYDDSLGFSANMVAWLTGKLSKDKLWQNMYENALEEVFVKNNEFAKGVAESASLYKNEISFVEDFLDILDETLSKEIPALQAAGGLGDIFALQAAEDQDLLVQCVVNLEYLTQIENNTTDKNLKKAAATARDRCFSKTFHYVEDKLKDFGWSCGFKIAEKAMELCVKKAWDAAAAGAASGIVSVKIVKLLVDVKDLAYELTGASKPLEAYFLICAASNIRESLYGYYGSILKSGKYKEIGETFSLIQKYTNQMYDNAETLLGSNHSKVLDSDSHYKAQRKDLPKLTMENYVKKGYAMLTPALPKASMRVEKGSQTQIPLQGIRHGVKVTYKETQKTNAFQVTKKGVIKASKKEGTGKVTVLVRQNNQEYSLVLTVTVGSPAEATDKPDKNKGIMAKKTLWKVDLGQKPFSLGVKTKSKGKITYKSSSPIALVDAAGRVTPKGYGEAKITVTVAKTSKYPKQTLKVTVRILPKAMKAPSVVSKKKGTVSVKWRPDKKASGYQIRYASNQKMSGAQVIDVKKNKAVSATLKKLPSKKTYYVQICAYKTVKKQQLAGKWSAAKKVRMK